jgi:CarD family transcriptional regulator
MKASARAKAQSKASATAKGKAAAKPKAAAPAKAPAKPKAIAKSAKSPTRSEAKPKAAAAKVAPSQKAPAKAQPAAKSAASRPAGKSAAAPPKPAAKAPAAPKVQAAAKAAPAAAPKAPAAAPKAVAPAKPAAPVLPPKPSAPPPPAATTPRPEMPRAPVPPPPMARGAPVSLPPPTHRPSASPLTSAAANRAAPRPKEDFKAGDHVVYPTHGVGQVQGIETVEAAGYSLSVIVVTFEENRMTLRVPVNKAASSGLRKLAAGANMQQALDTLKGRARIKRTMWSRRAQEYEAKINSGDPVQIAEVVRDLHRNAGQPDQSFSERQIYEQALDRLAAEVAAIDRSDKPAAIEKLLVYLGKADKGPRDDKADKGEDLEDAAQ